MKQGILNRRSILRVGGAGMLGLTMPKLLQASERATTLKPKAKSVIFLFQWGGPSQLDTFDMKPVRADHGPQPLSTDFIERRWHSGMRTAAGNRQADASLHVDPHDDSQDEESRFCRLLCAQRS